MKEFLIDEGGRYRIRMSVQAETKEEALNKFEDIVCNEVPIYLDLESIDTEVEEQEE